MTPIYISCDVTVSLRGAKAAGAYLNDATVTYTLLNADRTGVSGGTGTLTYVPGSNGNYAGTIDAETTGALTARSNYILQVDLDSGDYQDHRELLLVAQYRREF